MKRSWMTLTRSRVEEGMATGDRRTQLARQDLNLDNLDQNQVCYRYTTGQLFQLRTRRRGRATDRATTAEQFQRFPHPDADSRLALDDACSKSVEQSFRGESPRGRRDHQPRLIAPCGARFSLLPNQSPTAPSWGEGGIVGHHRLQSKPLDPPRPRPALNTKMRFTIDSHGRPADL